MNSGSELKEQHSEPKRWSRLLREQTQEAILARAAEPSAVLVIPVKHISDLFGLVCINDLGLSIVDYQGTVIASYFTIDDLLEAGWAID